MKKVIVAILVCILQISMLTGCGATQSTATEETINELLEEVKSLQEQLDEKKEVETTPEPTLEPTPEPKEEPTPTPKPAKVEDFNASDEIDYDAHYILECAPGYYYSIDGYSCMYDSLRLGLDLYDTYSPLINGEPFTPNSYSEGHAVVFGEVFEEYDVKVTSFDGQTVYHLKLYEQTGYDAGGAVYSEIKYLHISTETNDDDTDDWYTYEFSNDWDAINEKID